MASTMATELRRTAGRMRFYASGAARDLVPWRLYRFGLDRLLAKAEAHAGGALLADAAYLAKVEPPASTAGGVPIGSLRPWEHSRYYYDAIEYLKYFGRDRLVNYVFGDLRYVPERATIVKARPLDRDNTNSVILSLNKFRHDTTYGDPVPFEAKTPTVVWRGVLNNDTRHELVRRWNAHRSFDIGHNSKKRFEIPPKSYLHPLDQLRHRYVLAVEGNDVASNLRWVMASNSVCVMPRPTVETWFMHGRLVAGVHYAEVAADFSDLDAVVDHYESHPAEARAIVENAQRRVAAFSDPVREKYLSLLILRRYFVATGQWP